MAILSCMWAVGHRLDMLARASRDSETCLRLNAQLFLVHFLGAVSASPGLFCFLTRHSCLLYLLLPFSGIIIDLLLNYVCLCVHMPCECGCPCKPVMLDPLELELQTLRAASYGHWELNSVLCKSSTCS